MTGVRSSTTGDKSRPGYLDWKWPSPAAIDLTFRRIEAVCVHYRAHREALNLLAHRAKVARVEAAEQGGADIASSFESRAAVAVGLHVGDERQGGGQGGLKGGHAEFE